MALGLNENREGFWKRPQNWAQSNQKLTLFSLLILHLKAYLDKTSLVSRKSSSRISIFHHLGVVLSSKVMPLFIEVLAHLHAASRSIMLRENLRLSFLAFFARILIALIHLFRAMFWRSSWGKILANLVSMEILRCILSNSTNFAQFWVQMRELWPLEVKVFEVSFTRSLVFPAKIPVKPKMLSTNWNTLLVDEFTFFDKFPNFQTTLDQIGKILPAKVVSHVGILSNFQYLEFTFVAFPTYGWPNSRCRVLMILVFPESSWCLLSNVTHFLGIWV